MARVHAYCNTYHPNGIDIMDWHTGPEICSWEEEVDVSDDSWTKGTAEYECADCGTILTQQKGDLTRVYTNEELASGTINVVGPPEILREINNKGWFN